MEDVLGYSSITCDYYEPVEHVFVLKNNRYFLITNSHGDIKPPGQCSLGLFFDDTRVLSHYALNVYGGPPSLLSTQILRSFFGQIDLSIKDANFGGNSWDPKNCVHIRREFLLGDGMMERVSLTNYLAHPIDYWLELDLGSDFGDIFEVRGWEREKRGEYYAPVIEKGKITFSYRGLDGRLIHSTIRFAEPLPDFDSTRVRWEVRLQPNGRFQTEWEILTEVNPDEAVALFDMKHQEMVRTYEEWKDSCTKWNASINGLQDVVTRAVDDLRALHVEVEGVSVISAGIPWFSTIFGRDSIITSLQTLCLNPAIARETLIYLAKYQGSKVDGFTEEEPGKILHELRRGEMARNREIPHQPYYGTIDATPLWLILLHETWRWTGDEELIRQLLPNAERALEWIDRFGDVDSDGFVEYRNGAKNALANQGWKDSGDGVPYPDATYPEAPIALVEVQGYVYDAKLRMAELYEMMGDGRRAKELRDQSATLRKAIAAHFWMEEEGTFGLALDGDKKLLRTITSNAGHLLWSGVPSKEQASKMRDVLLGPSMFSGWGIRTLSSVHSVFNPMSYHNGSVWPHDNAIVITGLARYGMAESAVPVVRGLYDAATHDEFQRLPELFCGMSRGHGIHPVLYPVSCSPQAWATGTIFMLLQSMLGIHPEAHLGTLHIKNPVLPDFLNELIVSNLAVGNSKVSLQFSRYRDRTLANLLSVSGDPLKVQIELD
jgi:glycogen debranching enzyme